MAEHGGERNCVPIPITGTDSWKRRAVMRTGEYGGESLPKPAGRTRVWYDAGPPSLTAQKVYYHLLRHAYGNWNGQPGQAYATTFTAIAQFLNEGRSSRIGYRHIRQVLEEIARTPLKYAYDVQTDQGRERWEGNTVLMTFAASEEADKVVFHLPQDVERFLMDPEYYCHLEAAVVRNATCIYTIPAYEIFAPLVVSRDVGEATYDASEFAHLIGHPVPDGGTVEPARFKRVVIDRVVAEVNANSRTITVEASRSHSSIRFKAMQKGYVEAVNLDLRRPPEPFPGGRKPHSHIPGRPGKAVIAAWEETFPALNLDAWWTDFRTSCSTDPYYRTHRTRKFLERVRTLLGEQAKREEKAEKADWRTVEDSVLRLAVRQYADKLPRWSGNGVPPRTKSGRLLKIWHAYLHYIRERADEGDPTYRLKYHRAVNDAGREFMRMLAHDESEKWRFLKATENGAADGEDGDG